MMFFATFSVFDDVVDQLLLIVIIFLRKQDIFCTVCNTAVQSDVACTTSHNFDDTASFMRCGCITYFIDCFHCCIDRCIKSDRILGACNVQVDRSRDTDRVDTQSSQFLCTCEGSVTTDDYQSVNTMLSADFCTSCLSFRCTELCTSCCIQYSTATGNDIRYVTCCHIFNLFIQKTVISLIDTFYFQSSGKCFSNNRTNCRIHTRSIAAACKYAYCLYFFCHLETSSDSLFRLFDFPNQILRSQF